jgi:hypothetical protein
LAGEVAASVGWDGDNGPFFETKNAKEFVNASNPLRADQTIAALNGQLGFSGLDQVDTQEFLRRIEELLFCRQKILPGSGLTAVNAWLVAVEQVPNWATWTSSVWPRANSVLTGSGYIFVFSEVIEATKTNAANPPLRLSFEVRKKLQVQLAVAVAFRKVDSQAFTRINR